jgi:predicted CopG family antitoxin
MVTRTVALDEETYALLKRLKRTDESFSEAVRRLARPRRPITDFAGMWKDIGSKEKAALSRVYSTGRAQDRRRAEKLAQLWG